MFKFLHKLSRDDNGATAIEYGLIVSLVVIAIIVSMSSVATQSTGLWDTITERSKVAFD